MSVQLYISPSTQPGNAMHGGGTEQQGQYAIGALLQAALTRCGVSTYLSKYTSEGQYVQAAAQSDQVGARYHHALHSDASGSPAANWSHSIVAPGAGHAKAAAAMIQVELVKATGWPSRGVVERGDLWELTATQAHAVLTECGFHTNPEQAATIRARPQLFAEAYARAWCAVLGVTYRPPNASPTPQLKEDNVAAADVWAYGVIRPGDPNADKKTGRVPALQELADTKTIALRTEARLTILEAALSVLATSKGVDPAPIIAAVNAAAEQAAETIRRSLHGTQVTAVLDTQSTQA